jgi:sugar lactone lactonase YvrE
MHDSLDEEEMVMRFSQLLRVLSAVLLMGVVTASNAWNRGPSATFATLPTGTAYPEGITADASGNLYVANFDVSKSGGPGNIVVFNHAGKLVRTLSVSGSSNLLLGIAFHPQTGDLLVCDVGTHSVLKVNPLTGAATVFTSLPTGAGPNALAFDSSGRVYVSDSFGATIWRTPSTGGVSSAWLASPLLGTSGVPPFGANGMAFNKTGAMLFVANTGNDTVVNVPIQVGGDAGTPAIFVNSINGADGLMMDDEDNLWVAANQSDEIVVLDPTGRVIAKLGDFDGIEPNGAARGLLFPASLVRVGNFVYVTNLALDLRLFGLAQTTNSQWSANVSRYTISRISTHLPPVMEH